VKVKSKSSSKRQSTDKKSKKSAPTKQAAKSSQKMGTQFDQTQQDTREWGEHIGSYYILGEHTQKASAPPKKERGKTRASQSKD